MDSIIGILIELSFVICVIAFLYWKNKQSKTELKKAQIKVISNYMNTVIQNSYKAGLRNGAQEASQRLTHPDKYDDDLLYHVQDIEEVQNLIEKYSPERNGALDHVL